MTAAVSTPSQAMNERVRRYYDLVDADDVPGLIALFATDAVYHRPGYAPLVGHGDLNRFYTADRVIVSGRHTVTSLVTGEHEVAVMGEFAGVLKDGREVALRFADFFTLDERLLFARRDTYFFAPLV
ncbi:hypothetical protein Afil01_23520 [Actinorhabdospora filicis]|uniref:SnoaL-like domain-containing protein n=1 Tax=Actinorhabdospora filicis TaxID=1785913 RepID=A0A9W6SI51_9ACTN|nr:nuclear transport factor 2 family protein [Actinorhabdospora filicis]GLZ77545.1 hypothetical protein Afil01_23520 [Actinorhabdospora filicis]